MRTSQKPPKHLEHAHELLRQIEERTPAGQRRDALHLARILIRRQPQHGGLVTGAIDQAIDNAHNERSRNLSYQERGLPIVGTLRGEEDHAAYIGGLKDARRIVAAHEEATCLLA